MATKLWIDIGATETSGQSPNSRSTERCSLSSCAICLEAVTGDPLAPLAVVPPTPPPPPPPFHLQLRPKRCSNRVFPSIICPDLIMQPHPQSVFIVVPLNSANSLL